MLKNVDFDCEAIHLPINVLPVPGGPNNSIPLGGLRKPVKISGRRRGYTTASLIIDLAYSKPEISLQSVINDQYYKD